MADIRTRVVMTDAMSPAIKAMNKALGTVLSSFYNLQQATTKSVDTSAIDSARDSLAKFDTSAITEAQEQLALVEQQLDEISSDVDEINGKGGKTHDLLSGIGAKVLAMGGAYVGLGAIKKAIDYASDLAEVQNVVDVTFKSNAETVNEWSKTTLEAFGLNELTAKRFSGTMGAMLKSSGMAGKEVTDMAMKITELSGDMASFYNLEADEAFNKIRSGISGETEPLKQLGINMSVANLEAYALSQGISKPFEKMSQAEQVMLRYNYLLQATADAQGDFARTSDSFSNQMKLVKENWNQLTGQIAGYVLPLLAQGLQMVNNVLAVVSQNLDIILPAMGALVAIMAVYAGHLAVVHGIELAQLAIKGALAMLEGVHAIAIWATTSATWAEVMAQTSLNSALYACPLVWILGLIIAVVAVIYLVATAIAKVTGVASSGLGVIMGAVYAVMAVFQNLWIFLQTSASIIAQVFHNCAENMRIAFSNSIKAVQGFFYGLLATAMSVISQIAAALSKLPFVEFDASGLISKADEYAAKQAELAASKEDYKPVNGDQITQDAFANVEWKDIGEGFRKGAEKGDAWSAKIGDFFTGGADSGTSFAMDDIASGVGDIANNTGKSAGSAGDIANKLDATKEEIKYLRDIAEREAINRYTTASINVDMSGMSNTVNSGMDIDEFMDAFTESVEESIFMLAEGVHV